MTFKPIQCGIITSALFAASLCCINIFVQVANDQQSRIYGSVGLVAVSAIIIYAFVWIWNDVRTSTFYFVVIPLLLTSCFDFLLLVDLWREPNGIFLSELINLSDRHVHNVVAQHYMFLDGTICYVTNFAALWRIGNGLSARSLLLIPSLVLCFACFPYGFCAITSELTLHPLTIVFFGTFVVFMGLIPYGVLTIPRDFTLSHKNGSGVLKQVLALVTPPLLVAGGAVIVAKALVLSGVRNEYLDTVRFNDPLIFLNDVEKTYPLIAATIWQSVIMSLPLLVISFIYHFKSSKPTVLWELSIANLTLALLSQFAFIGGSLYWKTPKELRVDPTNMIFWIINLIPIVATLVQVISLLPHRSTLVSVKARAKKRS